ncbi:MAG: nitroreductase family protein, partial [Chloroflexi bacterium]|nr:nitroreductase family protein [Chloroflexota bacterium]
MSFLDLARRRYSVRSYRPDSVPDDLLATVLEAGRLAPTAANRQPFRIIVVRTAGREAELRRIYDREWFVSAPLVLCVCAIPGAAWSRIRRAEPRRRGRRDRDGPPRPRGGRCR